jgi:hypothetical protein
MKLLFPGLISLIFLFSGVAVAGSSPAEMISDFRLKHGEDHVTMDQTLNRIALEQANAMATKDSLSSLLPPLADLSRKSPLVH